MRRPVKFRLSFYLVAALTFYLGSLFLPEQLPDISGSLTSFWSNPEWQAVLLVSLVYFIGLPLLHWQWVIRIGQQAKWKLLIVLSLSSLVARYTYPEQIAGYFEFISWLKYPILAALLIVELYLLVTIVKAIWQARTLSGDPRLHMINKFSQTENSSNEAFSDKAAAKESKKLELALMLAHEPAGWYYAIPRFSHAHPQAITHLKLLSASRWHYALVWLLIIGVTFGFYRALMLWSETAALVVTTLNIYGSVLFVTNYRVSRHYSVYRWQDKLVINNSWWGLIMIDIDKIDSVQSGHWSAQELSEAMHFGRGDANVKIDLSQPQTYFSAMASFKDQVSTFYLSVESADTLTKTIEQPLPSFEQEEERVA